MILTCPNCNTRYLLSSSAIGEQGRDVRCAKCAHQWFQEGDTPLEPEGLPHAAELSENMFDEDPADSADSIEHVPEIDEPEEPVHPPLEEEPIPDSVKPLPEGSNVPAYAEDVLRVPPTLAARMSGYAAALSIFIVLIVAGFVFKQKVVALWPPAAMVYELAGMPVTFKGEGLVIESLSASILKNNKEGDVLVLKGRVINLTGRPIEVPPMMAVLRSTNGEDGDQWVIEPSVDQVEPGASFAFTSDYPALPRGVGSVNLTFVPTLLGAQNHTPAS